MDPCLSVWYDLLLFSFGWWAGDRRERGVHKRTKAEECVFGNL
jgi:hypothetical protein